MDVLKRSFNTSITPFPLFYAKGAYHQLLAE